MDNMERRYHENGKVWFECPLKNGYRDGACKEYYPSGALCSTATYREGLLDGPRIMTFENGLRICRHVFRDGRVIDGFVPVFGRDGSLAFSEYWEKGRCRCYDRSNRLYREFGMLNRMEICLKV